MQSDRTKQRQDHGVILAWIVLLICIIVLLSLGHQTLRTSQSKTLSIPTVGFIGSNKTRVFTLEPRTVYLRDVWISGHVRPHPELCPNLGGQLRLFIFVTSAPENAASRDAVRHTWGQHRGNVSLAFIIGGTYKHFHAALDHEDAIHGDLVISRNLDSYSNLSLKTLAILQWIDKYCPLIQFLLKTDDDVFINIPRLLRFISAPKRINATRTIWGKLSHNERPKRRRKYRVSKDQFPGKVYLNFVTGPAYLMTVDCVKSLLIAANASAVRYVRLEDVFVTGVLGALMGLKRQHAYEFYNTKCASDPCSIRNYIAVHKVRYYEQFDFWRKLFDNTTKCTAL